MYTVSQPIYITRIINLLSYRYIYFIYFHFRLSINNYLIKYNNTLIHPVFNDGPTCNNISLQLYILFIVFRDYYFSGFELLIVYFYFIGPMVMADQHYLHQTCPRDLELQTVVYLKK